MYDYNAEMIRVVDADTIDFLVDLGFNVHHVVRVRLLGVDAPEIYGVKRGTPEHEAGQKAADFVRGWFRDRDKVYLQTTKTGKYGRWLGVVLRDPVGATENPSEHPPTLNHDLKAWLEEQES